MLGTMGYWDVGDLMVHVCVWCFLGYANSIIPCVSSMWRGLCVSVCTGLPGSFEPLRGFPLRRSSILSFDGCSACF